MSLFYKNRKNTHIRLWYYLFYQDFKDFLQKACCEINSVEVGHTLRKNPLFGSEWNENEYWCLTTLIKESIVNLQHINYFSTLWSHIYDAVTCLSWSKTMVMSVFCSDSTISCIPVTYFYYSKNIKMWSNLHSLIGTLFFRKCR